MKNNLSLYKIFDIIGRISFIIMIVIFVTTNYPPLFSKLSEIDSLILLICLSIEVFWISTIDTSNIFKKKEVN